LGAGDQIGRQEEFKREEERKFYFGGYHFHLVGRGRGDGWAAPVGLVCYKRKRKILGISERKLKERIKHQTKKHCLYMQGGSVEKTRFLK